MMSKKLIYFLLTGIILLVFTNNGKSQAMYVGVTAGMAQINFRSQNAGDIISANPGYDLGFYIKTGHRLFYQAGLNWTNSQIQIKYNQPGVIDAENITSHNFKLPLKIGYRLLQKPMFKWNILAGPFIGKTLFKSANNIPVKKSDFLNPQYGLVAGTGIRLTNFIFDVEYAYYVSQLFKNPASGSFPLSEARLDMITLKVGVQF
ncbi:MAG: PorT family protein [Chlorobi bacterium]|nr:PorT family protein [Chlorobiota bacterium]